MYGQLSASAAFCRDTQPLYILLWERQWSGKKRSFGLSMSFYFLRFELLPLVDSCRSMNDDIVSGVGAWVAVDKFLPLSNLTSMLSDSSFNSYCYKKGAEVWNIGIFIQKVPWHWPDHSYYRFSISIEALNKHPTSTLLLFNIFILFSIRWRYKFWISSSAKYEKIFQIWRQMKRPNKSVSISRTR